MFEVKKFSGIGRRAVTCDECGVKHVVIQFTPSPRVATRGNVDLASMILENEQNKKRRVAEIRAEVEAKGYRLIVCDTDVNSLKCCGCGCVIELPTDFWDWSPSFASDENA